MAAVLTPRRIQLNSDRCRAMMTSEGISSYRELGQRIGVSPATIRGWRYGTTNWKIMVFARFYSEFAPRHDVWALFDH